jgi:hypothetical protein
MESDILGASTRTDLRPTSQSKLRDFELFQYLIEALGGIDGGDRK